MSTTNDCIRSMVEGYERAIRECESIIGIYKKNMAEHNKRYELGIKEHEARIDALKIAVLALQKHVIEEDETPLHDLPPIGENQDELINGY